MSSPSQEQGELLQPIEPSSPYQQDSSNTNPVNESPAQEAARLRRERRNAKIQSGGSARLDAISRLSGRRAVGGEGDGDGEEKKGSGAGLGERATEANEISSPALDPDVSVPSNTIPRQAAAPAPAAAGPLNQNPNYKSNTNSTNPSATEPDPVLQAMRQMLAGQDSASDPSSSSSPSNNPTSDPTTALLTALLGGSTASGASGASGTNFDTQQSNPAQSQRPQQNQRAVLYWRLIHALIFFSLALHFVIYGHPSFNGTKVQRDHKSPTNVNDNNDSGNYHDPSSPQSTTTLSFLNLSLNYWLLFLALELALQSGRFVLGGEEGINASSSPAAAGSTGSANIMALLLNFLPPPWAGYVKVSSRYWYMFRTVKADVLMFVFVLGVGGWLRA